MNKECCNNKKTVRSEDEKKIINNRLNRIEGQVKGIKNMVAEDRYCNDILIQLSAIESSIKSLSMHILENHLYSCITDSIEMMNTAINMPPDAFSFPDAWLFRGAACRTVRCGSWTIRPANRTSISRGSKRSFVERPNSVNPIFYRRCSIR